LEGDKRQPNPTRVQGWLALGTEWQVRPKVFSCSNRRWLLAFHDWLDNVARRPDNCLLDMNLPIFSNVCKVANFKSLIIPFGIKNRLEYRYWLWCYIHVLVTYKFVYTINYY
jgi:hypothetical protein